MVHAGCMLWPLLPIDEIIRGRKSDFVKTCNSSGFGLISR
jgi:hypothetical protein